MGEAGEAPQPLRDRFDVEPERARGGESEGGVLAIVRAAQSRRDAQIDQRRGGALHEQAMIVDEDVGRLGARGRDADDLAPLGDQSRRDGAAIVVVEPDQRDIRGRDEPLLDRGVILHRPVAVEMIGRQVDEKADARPKRRRKVDLEGRALQHMNAIRRRRRQVEHGHADVAAERDVAACLGQDMGDQRRRRRFAVGAGDGDERRGRRARRPLAREELDVADHFDAGRPRALDGPMRLRMGQRHARRQYERRKAATSRLTRDRPAGPLRPWPGYASPSSQAATSRPAGDERARGGEPRTAEAEQSDALSRKCRDRRHAHLSFRVERPTIASTKAMIQNRMTICGSDQPSCSK